MSLSLVLRAVPGEQPNVTSPARVGDTRSLTRGNLTIGRGPINDWVLVDPLLSKTHCAVSLLDGRFVLTDLSTNGVFVNGARQRMAKDSKIVLTDGDSFALGAYVVEVAIAGVKAAGFDDGATVAPFSRGRDAGQGGQPPGPLSYVDRGDDEDPLQTVPPRARRGADLQPPAPHVPHAAGPAGLPRGIDPFDLLDDPPGHTPAPDADDLFKGREADPSWSGAAQRDDVDASEQAFKAPKALWSGRLDDEAIDDLLGDDFPDDGAAPPPVAPKPAAPRPAPPPPAVVHADPISPFDEPEAAPVVARTARPPAAPSAAAKPQTGDGDGAGDGRLLAAFLAGAGAAHLDLSQQDAEAYLRSMGELMRLMIERLREVLMSRAEVKRELGVEQTILRSRNNNALKFSMTPEDAVAALLQPNRPGYLPPMQAAREALDDIGSHQVAVMAGVQTALVELLKRFDPAALEKRLTGGSFLDNIMPSARKARIWELFCATYKDIASEAEEDFQSLFGREFARGYNEQVRKQ